MNRNFMEMLAAKQAAGKLVCVGLDSEFGKIPESAQRGGEKGGVSVTETIAYFNRQIVEATKDIVGCYKPNSAFYEAHGAEGIEALRVTIAHIKAVAPDVPVILDAKRADIGNTNDGYAKFAFEKMGADAITVHPYLGREALQPFLDYKDKGIIVLCRTSNKGAGEFQDLFVELSPQEMTELVGDEIGVKSISDALSARQLSGNYHLPMYEYVALRVSHHWSKNCALVVRATYPKELAIVRFLVGDDMPILIPGIGAQGGDLEATVKAGKNSRGEGMIINSSRGIIFASKGEDFAEAALREAQKLQDQITQCLKGDK